MSDFQEFCYNMEIPEDTIRQSFVIEVIGNHLIYVTNYKALNEYTTECIRISSGAKEVQITGTNLHIPYYSKRELHILGQIKSIGWCRNKGRSL